MFLYLLLDLREKMAAVQDDPVSGCWVEQESHTDSVFEIIFILTCQSKPSRILVDVYPCIYTQPACEVNCVITDINSKPVSVFTSFPSWQPVMCFVILLIGCNSVKAAWTLPLSHGAKNPIRLLIGSQRECYTRVNLLIYITYCVERLFFIVSHKFNFPAFYQRSKVVDHFEEEQKCSRSTCV